MISNYQLKTPFEKIALSLSGGGYRAAAFHLGSMAYLDHAKFDGISLLENVKIISTVSGGTITGVFYAYRIKEDGTSCAYITDNELDPPEKVTTTYGQWVEFCRGVDVLIHDAQYLESDMPHKHGWGPSLRSQVRQLAVDAEVGCLVMFHHDPDRTDTEIDFIQKDNEHFFYGKHVPSISLCAAENMLIKLTPQQDKNTVIEVGRAEF